MEKRFPPLDTVIHIGVTEIIVNAIWWGVGKVLAIQYPVRDWGFLALTALTFILIVWYLRKRTEVKSRKDTEPKLPVILKGVQFYATRQPLSWFRDKVNSARSIWAAYLIGGSTNNSELLKSGNFRRLLLLDPENEAVKAIQEMESDKTIDTLRKTIRELTDYAKRQNCDVRWCKDITYSLLTIGNPPVATVGTPPDDMWVLVEVYLPGVEAEKRPSFLVERSSNQGLADRLLFSFTKSWEHCKPARY